MQHFFPIKLTKLLLGGLALVVALTGVMVRQTIFQALHPERTICQVNPDRLIIPPQPISFHSQADGTMLKGWFLEASDPRGTLILAHGYRQNRLPDIPEAVELINYAVTKGFNCLLFDFRGCGESDGSLTTLGFFESSDLLAAVHLARTKLAPENKVFVLGMSLGAVTALLAAARSPEISGLVLDSPFADLENYLEQNLQVWSHLPAIPFNYLLLALGQQSIGFTLADVSPIEAAGKVTIPVLIIHSLSDKQVPASDGIFLYTTVKSAQKELWLTPNANHSMSFAAYPEEYKTRILAFLEFQLSD